MKKSLILISATVLLFSLCGCNGTNSDNNNDLLARIIELETKAAELETKATGLETKAAGLETKAAVLETENDNLRNQLNEITEKASSNFYTNTGVFNLFDKNGPEHQDNTEIKFYFEDVLTFSVRIIGANVSGISNLVLGMVIENYTDNELPEKDIHKHICIYYGNTLLANTNSYDASIPAYSKIITYTSYGQYKSSIAICDIGVYSTGKYIPYLPMAIVKDVEIGVW